MALAGARLRALGARTIPERVRLRDVAIPRLPEQVDLSVAAGAPDVCAARLRFRAADAARAESLAASRPRLVASGSLTQAAQSLAGLLSGNPLAVAGSLAVEGGILDGGAARDRLDQARLGVAQAEIGWLQARARVEVAILEAAVDLHGAAAELSAVRVGYAVAEDERDAATARRAAGVEDGGGLVAAETARLDAQIAVDAARARAVRAVVVWEEVAVAPVRCPPR